MSILSLQTELTRLKGLQQIRDLYDNITRAAFILINYCGEYKFSIRQLSRSFKVNRRSIERRVLRILEGHTTHDCKKTRYLSEFHESCLAEILRQSEDKRESISDEEVFQMICFE